MATYCLSPSPNFTLYKLYYTISMPIRGRRGVRWHKSLSLDILGT